MNKDKRDDTKYYPEDVDYKHIGFDGETLTFRVIKGKFEGFQFNLNDNYDRFKNYS